MDDNPIIFEQPLNEHIRLCLRLEELFSQLSFYASDPHPNSSRIALITILTILDVIDRPDIRSKISQRLIQHSDTLNALREHQHIDQNKLHQLIAHQRQIAHTLQSEKGKLALPLRENPFLAHIKAHLHNPGGACTFAIPDFNLWLNQPATLRLQALQQWCRTLDVLQDAVMMILKVVRESAPYKTVTAKEGLYHQTLPTSATLEMIRIALPPTGGLYPEVSVGKHRISIRLHLLQNFEQGHSHLDKTDCLLKLCFCAVEQLAPTTTNACT